MVCRWLQICKYLVSIKPYLFKRSNQGQSKIISTESNTTISNESQVAETFDNYFVDVAEDIGKNYVFYPQNHPSLKKIKELNFKKNDFDFKPSVSKIIT